MNRRNIIIIGFALLAYISGTVSSYLLFSQTSLGKQLVTSKPPVSASSSGASNTPTHQDANGTMVFDQSQPRTEQCPTNGVLYSQEQKKWWEQHEPIAAMIENHSDARPQSGLSYADVIYEAVAEGGITRFAAIFYCQDAPEIGPIRSARIYFINFVSEYGAYPLYTHVGGANADGQADALGALSDYGWTGYNDLNQFSIGFPTFWRDYNRQGHEVATEHTMYSTTGKLWSFAKKDRNITNVTKDGQWDKNFQQYQFKDDAASSERPKSQSIHLEFWTGDPDYYDDWTYDAKTNLYNRKNGGVPHVDRDNNRQLTTKNLIVLHMIESHADDGYEDNIHLLYKNIGSGKADIFMDGKQISGTWKKASRTSRMIIYDTTGKEISFDRGTLWFSVLPLTGVMEVK